MSAFYFSVSNNQPLMVIPDTTAHLNGHEVITYTYSVYKDMVNYSPNQVNR